jgi:hypothetical protein
MRPVLVVAALWSIAAVASAHTARDSNCYQVFGELRCDIKLEPKPPMSRPPTQPDGAGQPCRDASGKPAACPAAPKH